MTSSTPPTASATPAAWIQLDGVVNMRDLGGTPTTDGATIAPGRLIRSDNLQDLTGEAVRHLVDRVGVSDVIDLRTVVEVAKTGAGPLRSEPAVRHHHHTLYREDSAETGIPAAERDLPWRSGTRPSAAETPIEIRESADSEVDGALYQEGDAVPGEEVAARHDAFWSEHYLSYLNERPDAVAAALRDIAAAPGAVIVHCAAGKDRTGTIVALALTLAGATREAVIADYGRSAERIEAIMDRLRASPAYAENLRGKSNAQQTTQRATMALMLEAIDERGGVAAVLAPVGWTAADTEALRAKLRD